MLFVVSSFVAFLNFFLLLVMIHALFFVVVDVTASSALFNRQLLTLVKKCLVFDSNARISPQQLLREVQTKTIGRDGGMKKPCILQKVA